LSAGTYLDSQRFRVHLGKHFSVDPAHVEAQVIGDHGTVQVFLWSSARVGGVPITTLLKKRGENLKDLRERIEKEVRYANITIIEGHNASQYGIGIVSVRIAEMVLKDERAVIPIGSFHKKLGVTLSLPSVVGRGGIIDVLSRNSRTKSKPVWRTAPKSSKPPSREFAINDLCSTGRIHRHGDTLPILAKLNVEQFRALGPLLALSDALSSRCNVRSLR
jgi:malate/lactate dehydrogenase